MLEKVYNVKKSEAVISLAVRGFFCQIFGQKNNKKQKFKKRG